MNDRIALAMKRLEMFCLDKMTGNITIHVKDGVPQSVKTEEFHRFDEKLGRVVPLRQTR